MAQITFFATDQDCKDLWQFLLIEMNLKAFPNPWFGDLPAPTLASPADVEENRKQSPLVAPALSFFLTSSDWSIEPLEYHSCKDNPNFEPHWYISHRNGGPSINFLPRYGYPWHNPTAQIIAGQFTDYPYYYSLDKSSLEKIIERPDGLHRAMKMIGQRLRSHGKIVCSPLRKRAIAMQGALKAHQDGVVLRLGDIEFAER